MLYLINIMIIVLFGVFYSIPNYSEIHVVSIEKKKRSVVNGKQTVFFLVFFLLLFLEMGLRGDFNIDTRNYYYIFENAQNYYEREDFLKIDNEPLFYLINYLIKKITSNYLFFLFFYAFVIAFCYVLFIKRESNVPWISALVLLCSGSFYTGFNVMRQIVAASMFSLLYKYIYERKFKSYVLGLLVISLIHKSCFILLPIYFLPKLKWKRKNIYFIIPMMIFIVSVFYLFTDNILSFITRFFYSNYDENSYGMDSGTSLITMLKHVVLYGGVLACFPFFDNKNARDMLIYNGCFIGLIIVVCGAKILMIQRFTHYFIPCMMLGYATILSRIKTKKSRLLMGLLVSSLLIASIFNTIVSSNYYFYWDNIYIKW